MAKQEDMAKLKKQFSELKKEVEALKRQLERRHILPVKVPSKT